MKRIGPVLALLFATARALSAAPAAIEGLWLTEDRDGIIAIRPCATDSPRLCGWIVGNNLAPGEAMPLDVNGVPHCGLQLISDLREIEPGVWDGDIRDPRDGKVYSSRLRIGDRGELRLRGYVLVPLFGSTQIWSRWGGTVTPPPECKISPKP